jgi:hypothetical protein
MYSGTVIGHCVDPTVTIQLDDGSRVAWRADQCERSGETLRLQTGCLGETVVAKTMDGMTKYTGKVIRYCIEPTVTIQLDDGSRVAWCVDLCELRDTGD